MTSVIIVNPKPLEESLNEYLKKTNHDKEL